MYSVYLDQQLIHDLDSEDNVLISPTLNLELNKAGTFEFSMECTHPFYDKLESFKSIIQVLCDGDEIFKGRIIEITDDMYKERKVYCESELAYLNDTIQRPYEFHLAADAVVEYLNLVIGSHNEQVDDARQFELGMITVKDPNNYIYCYTNYNSTMDEIKEDLVDDLGGYIRVRNVYANDNPLGTLQHRYIDYIYLEEYGDTSTQYIEFGENLLDFSNDINQADICTGIIPLGATLEESEYAAIEERVTIKSVNDDVDYLVITDAVAKYGLILKVVTWDDITEPGNLKTAGENYLAEYNYEPQTIEATAVDMHLTDEQIMAWRLGDMVFVESEPHDVHARYPLAQMQIPLDQPENTSVTLGTYEDVSLTARTNKTESGLRNMEDFTTGNIIASAVAQATNILNGAIHGYVTLNLDDDGHPYELLIMDTESTDTATKVWRWNMGGLGYSSTGYNKEESAYTTAITMDGHILGTLIIANGMILADDNDATFGKFTDQGMEIYEQAGKTDDLLMSIGQEGMKLYGNAYWLHGLMAEFNGNGVTVYGTAEQPLLELNKNGMTINDNDGDMLANIGQAGIWLYSTDGIPRSSLDRNNVAIYDADGLRLMNLSRNGLQIYNSDNVELMQLDTNGLYYNTTSGDPLVRVTQDGLLFYYNQNSLGAIGRTQWVDDPSCRGLMLGLRNGGGFLSLGYEETSSSSLFITKIAYHSSYGASSAGVHFGDTTFLNNYNLYFGEDTSGGYVRASSGTSGELGASFYGSYWFNDGTLRYNSYEVATKNDIAGLSLLANGEEAEGEFSLYSGLQLDISELVNYKSSDETLKTSIQAISDARVDNITPVTFKWRDGDNTAHYGYIAQEVREHIPEIVKENDDGLLSLAYTEIIPLLHAKINTLEERIARLEELIYGEKEK